MMGKVGPIELALCAGALVFFLVLIVVVALLFRALVRPQSARPGPSSNGSGPSPSRALEILKERYARGEITKEQYEEMRRDLES